MDKIKTQIQEEEKRNKKEEFYYQVHNYYGNLCPHLRKYPIEIVYDGKKADPYNQALDLRVTCDLEKVKKGIKGPVIFACNHSNTHDFYTAQEIFGQMVNVFAAEDCLSPATKFLFKLADSILIDRGSKSSSAEGFNQLIEKLYSGNDVVIFPETTWNQSPSKPMLPMKLGAAKASAKTGFPIIPTVFEYVENDKIGKKESEIIEKCIVTFGEPIYVHPQDNYIEATEQLRDALATIRWKLWEQKGYYFRQEASPLIYENHNNLKSNTPLFKYDHDKEKSYVYGNENYIYEEYPLNRVYYDKDGNQIKTSLNKKVKKKKRVA